MGERQTIEIAKLTLDPDLHVRVQLDLNLVARYAADMKRGDVFPPVPVFFDGKTRWLAGGRHRVAARLKNNETNVEIELFEGGKREALLFAVKADAFRARKMTNADKQRAVRLVLADKKLRGWSDRAIAAQCGVAHPLVGELRAKYYPKSVKQKLPDRNGHTRGRAAPEPKSDALPPRSAVFHEAGHGVVAVLQNRDVPRLSLKRPLPTPAIRLADFGADEPSDLDLQDAFHGGIRSDDWQSRDVLEKNVMFWIAGVRAALELVPRQDRPSVAAIWEDDDFPYAGSILNDLEGSYESHGDYFGYLQERASQILRAHWDAVRAVADALEAQGALAPEETRKLVREHMPIAGARLPKGTKRR